MRVVTNDKLLAKARVEIAPLKDKVSPLEDKTEEGNSSDSDALSAESEPDFEGEEKKEANPRRPDPVKAKKPLRRSSKIIVDSVHEFEPKLSDCKSDTNCVMAYVIDNVKLLDKTYGKDLEQLEKELELLRKLITTMYHPRTSTMRGMFVKYTVIFKAYYVNPPYNET